MHRDSTQAGQTPRCCTVAQCDTAKPLRDKLADTLSRIGPELWAAYETAHAGYYDKVWQKLPYARQRYAELSTEIAVLNRHHNSKAKSLQKVLNTFAALVNSEAAKHTSVDAYLAQVRRDFAGQSSRTFDTMVAKAEKAGLDTPTAKVRALTVLDDGVDITLTDGAGNSMQMVMTVRGGGGPKRMPLFNVKADNEVVVAARQATSAATRGSRGLPLKTGTPVPAPDVAAIPAGMVTKAKIVEYNGKLFVTCHIAGQRQSSIRIQPDEWKKYISRSDSDKTALAAAHYPMQIARAMMGASMVTSRRETSPKR